jgi:hypothetical protein
VRIFAEGEYPVAFLLGRQSATFFFWLGHSSIRSRSTRKAARNGVRIRRSEFDKLACQAKSVRIFAEGEYPVAFLLGRQSATFFFWLGHSSIRSRSARGAARNGVRIRRSEIDKLACQAKSERIFA